MKASAKVLCLQVADSDLTTVKAEEISSNGMKETKKLAVYHLIHVLRLLFLGYLTVAFE